MTSHYYQGLSRVGSLSMWVGVATMTLLDMKLTCKIGVFAPHKKNKQLMSPCSDQPASRGRRPNNLATFCLGCCRGIRKTGWTLVSDDV